MKHPKLRSTTFWLSIIMLILNPLAWVMDWLIKKDMLRYVIENGIENQSVVQALIVQIPLGTIATATVTVLTAYVAGNKARNVATNLSLPQGQDGRTANSEESRAVQ